MGPLTPLIPRRGSPQPLAHRCPRQIPCPAPWIQIREDLIWFCSIFASSGPMKTRKVQDPAMGTALRSSVQLPWSGTHIPCPPPGQLCLSGSCCLVSVFSRWLQPCKAHSFSLSTSTVGPTPPHLWVRAELVPRASPSLCAAIWAWAVVPQHMFFTHVFPFPSKPVKEKCQDAAVTASLKPINITLAPFPTWTRKEL